MRSAGGTVFYVRCEFTAYDPNAPHERETYKTKTGTAFLLRFHEANLIVTAYHVIADHVAVMARTSNVNHGDSVPLQVIACNPSLDVALMWGPPELMTLPAFAMGDSLALVPGSRVMTSGHAGGFDRLQATYGAVSAISDYPHHRITTDAAFNGGNSGGAVCLADTMAVVGVVTSGEDDMQNTNYFCGMHEVALSIRAMLRTFCARDTFDRPVVDMGRHLNAVVRPIHSDACDGQPGGAYVAHAGKDCELRAGDVVCAVRNPLDGQMVEVSSALRCNVSNVWKTNEAIDFRNLLDFLTTPVWRMRVRRHGAYESVDVRVGRDTFRSREHAPGCEPVPYVCFGGLVCQTLSVSHDVPEGTFETPKSRMVSKVVITFVVAGSPFSSQGSLDLRYETIVGVYHRGSDRCVAIKSLDALAAVVAHDVPSVLKLGSGHVVGAAPDALVAFEKTVTNPNLRKGKHACLLGTTNPARYVVPRDALRRRLDERVDEVAP